MLGIDLVHIPSFGLQLAQPGTQFLQRAFSVSERFEASRRHLPSTQETEYYAGRWAAKEAFIKAWSQSLFGLPPAIAPEELDWREIAVIADVWGRVSIQLTGAVARAFVSGGADYCSAATVGAGGAGGAGAGAGAGDAGGAGGAGAGGAGAGAGAGDAGGAGAAPVITRVSISHDGDYATAIVAL